MIWRYYFKTMRYEQFFVPAAMMGICLVLILLMKTTPNIAHDPSTSIALAFMEAALPLATALIATGLFLNDPLLELYYTVPRPLWRILLERLALLVGVMTLFYGLFTVLVRLMGVPLAGWGDTPFALFVWLVPAVAWLGLTFCMAALIRNNVAGNGLSALLWIGFFMAHTIMLESPNWRVIYPFMTIFEPTSTDWITNRFALLVIGIVAMGAAFIMLRNSEQYFKSEA